MSAADLQMVINAISSPLRREILWLTWTDELSVGDIGAHFEVTGATLSSHLASLREAGLVEVRIDGNFRRYRCRQDAVAAIVPLLAMNDERWVAAEDIPERALADHRRGVFAEVSVEVLLAPATAFAAFADGDRYSEWLGAPVSIRDGRFRATLEWGTEVRGTYEVVSAPDLIAMRWDFDDDAVPIPGGGLVAYLRIRPHASGTRVEVHQLADDDRQLAFLVQAWSMVLGRFRAWCEGSTEPGRRPPRPKRTRTTR